MTWCEQWGIVCERGCSDEDACGVSKPSEVKTNRQPALGVYENYREPGATATVLDESGSGAGFDAGTQTPSPSTHVLVFPRELTDDLRDILSMMMWNTGPIAHALRAGGVEIKTRAEDEQAHVMHWLITLALEHGSTWREKVSDRIHEIRAALAATEGSK